MQITDSYTIGTRLVAKRNGAVFKELQGESITITMSTVAEIKSSMAAFVLYDPDINLLSDTLCPEQIINGQSWPLGEYIITGAPKSKRDGRDGWQVEGYDQCLVLKQTTTAARYYLAAGTGYIPAIQDLLIACGIRRAIFAPSAAVLAAEREWEPGTEYLAIVNTLLAEINFGSLWFDREGVAQVRPADDATQQPIRYAEDEYSMLVDDTMVTSDTYNAYNVFTAVVSSPDTAPMVAVAVNDSPASPISTVNRGRRICAPIEYLDAIASQEALQEHANTRMLQSMRSTEEAAFFTLPLPRHWYNDLVVLPNALYRETGWELVLGPAGRYSHTAKREVQS